MIRRLLAIALLLPTLAWADYDSVVAADSPSDWWKLNDTSGTTITATNGGHNGTIAGIYSLNQTGFPYDPDVAISFAGQRNDTDIDFGSGVANFIPSATNNAGWSFEVWINPTSVAVTGIIVGVTSATQYNWDSVQVNNTLRFLTTSSNTSCGGGQYGTTGFVGSMSAGSWYHVVGTTLGGGSSTLQHMRLYLNASLISTVSSFGSAPNNNICTTANNLNLALRKQDIGGSAVSFGGIMAQLAIYQTELSQAQVTSHYQAGTVAAATVINRRRIFQSRRTVFPREWLPVSFGVREPPPMIADLPTFVIDRLNQRAQLVPSMYK